MTRTPESRKIFIDSLVEFLRKYKFEGICYDWEFPVLGAQFSYTEPKPEESAQLVALTKETRESFDKLSEETGKNYEITVSLNCAEKNIKYIDIKAISDYADNLAPLCTFHPFKKKSKNNFEYKFRLNHKSVRA